MSPVVAVLLAVLPLVAYGYNVHIDLNDTNDEGSTVNCPDDIDCYVHCNGKKSCKDTTIKCPDSTCTVECKGSSSCRDVVIKGGDSSTVNIKCIGKNSCRGATIDADNSGELKLTGCEMSGSCIGIALFCPQNVDGQAKCTVIHGDEFGGTESEPLEIYAVYGFIDMNITGTAYSEISDDASYSQYAHGTMYCTDDYSSSCDIHEDDWKCDDTNETSICDMDRAYIAGSIPIHQLNEAEEYTMTSPKVAIWENTGFIIVLGIGLTLIMTICYMKYLMKRKPQSDSPQFKAVPTRRNKKQSEEPSDDSKFDGITLHHPEDSGSYNASQHDTDSGQITATPSIQGIDPVALHPTAADGISNLSVATMPPMPSMQHTRVLSDSDILSKLEDLNQMNQ